MILLTSIIIYYINHIILDWRRKFCLKMLKSTSSTSALFIFSFFFARFLTPTQSSRLYLPLGGDSDPVNLTLSSIPLGRVSQFVTNVTEIGPVESFIHVAHIPSDHLIVQ